MFKKLVFILLCSSSAAFAAAPSGMNFRFSPIGLIVGAVNADLDYQVTPNWTVGPEVSYWHIKFSSSAGLTNDIDVTAFSVGVRGNWFKNGAYTDGLYVGPSLSYASVKAKSKDSSGDVTGTASGAILTGLVGYGWFWDSFNMMLGGGLAVPLGDNQVTVKDSSGTEVKENITSSLALEFSLGWTF